MFIYVGVKIMVHMPFYLAYTYIYIYNKIFISFIIFPISQTQGESENYFARDVSFINQIVGIDEDEFLVAVNNNIAAFAS